MVPPRGETLLSSSNAAFGRGELGTAKSFAEEAREEAFGTDNFELQARASFALAGIHRWVGSEDSALALVELGIAAARRTEMACLVAEGLLVRCGVLFSQKALSGRDLDGLYEQSMHCGAASVEARAGLMEVRFAARSGEIQTAYELLDRSTNVSAPYESRSQIHQEKRFLKAYLFGLEHRYEEAIETATSVLRDDREKGQKPVIVDDLWLLARLYRDAGNSAAARDAAERALSVLEAMSPPDMTAKRKTAYEAWIDELRD